MKFLLLFLTLIIGQIKLVDCISHSPLKYDAIFVIVIIELVFAFSVGIVCIIFSFNLLRAVSQTDNNAVTLSPRKFNYSRLSNVVDHTSSSRSLSSDHEFFYDSDDGELDYESTPKASSTITSMLKSFTDYLRLWQLMYKCFECIHYLQSTQNGWSKPDEIKWEG